MQVKVNSDQFCPLCYDKENIMRNVYSSNSQLICPVHGAVMVEDGNLKHYKEMDYDKYLSNIGVKDEAEVVEISAEIGKAIVGKATI